MACICFLALSAWITTLWLFDCGMVFVVAASHFKLVRTGFICGCQTSIWWSFLPSYSFQSLHPKYAFLLWQCLFNEVCILYMKFGLSRFKLIIGRLSLVIGKFKPAIKQTNPQNVSLHIQQFQTRLVSCLTGRLLCQECAERSVKNSELMRSSFALYNHLRD